jgi:hypothetical protein
MAKYGCSRSFRVLISLQDRHAPGCAQHPSPKQMDDGLGPAQQCCLVLNRLSARSHGGAFPFVDPAIDLCILSSPCLQVSRLCDGGHGLQN